MKRIPALLIAILGSASLIVQWYWTRPLWVDEEMIALNLRDRSFSELTGVLWLNQAAPLGWLWAQRAALLLFGSDERTLRALPVLFGLATIWVAWWAGRRWLTPVGAAVFTLLCAFGVYVSFFPLEAKHYSGDTFFGLLIPCLGLWAVDPVETERVPRWGRMATFWLAAAAGQWLAHGALFVAPGCAVALFLTTWRYAGPRAALLSSAFGLVLVASFAIHYLVSLQYTLHNDYLQQYWWHAFPPRGAGVVQTLQWLAAQIPKLAENPGGTRLWIGFWLAAVAGSIFALRHSLAIGTVVVAVTLSAFAFAAARLVPLEERLALWVMPSLYLAIAFTAQSIRPGLVRIALAALALVVACNIAWAGIQAVRLRPQSNHGLDDRSGVRFFLMSQRQPGDVIVGTRMGMPAIWWYGGVDVGDPNLGRAIEREAIPLLEVHHGKLGPDCRDPDLMTALEGRSRVAIYLGFASHVPPGFQELVLDTLSARGRLTAYKRIAEEGFAAVFDLRQPPASWETLVYPAPPKVPRPPGCVGFFPTERW